MVHRLVIFFLLFALLFALAHMFAMAASLYWYYWWSDILMHTWGGVLIGIGIHALSTFKWLPLRPTLGMVVFALVVATGSWELFERSAGLYSPTGYVSDTTIDVLCGFGGGLIAHFFLQRSVTKKVS